jgi:1-pyrroline-5-carboxylate dehydrogenase
MQKGYYQVPQPTNEPVKQYAPGSEERKLLKAALLEARSKVIDIPMIIGGKEIRTGNTHEIRPPHDLKHKLGQYHQGEAQHIQLAINEALKAKENWERMSWESRASIFLKAADLLAGPRRYQMNAATMLCQSKNAYQAEIDAACELIDFWRFNVYYMAQLYGQQPISPAGFWNKNDYRPLEGFVFALTPFNFTSIAGNLPTAPALMGNTVVWKPANTQIYAAYHIMQILQEAGLPDGVINLIYVPGPIAGDIILEHVDFAGIHYTGSTKIFSHIWNKIAHNLLDYKSYPRIVGETGGKDFVLIHPSANASTSATALSRGAFEYQGQKCSAASRAYVPRNLWPEIKTKLLADLASFRMGPVEDFRNFINAVIDEESFNKIAGYIEQARADSSVAEIIAGGKYDKSIGYFIEPTVIVTTDPNYKTIREEIFGPVLTIYVYEDEQFDATVNLVDQTSAYGLTGSIFASDRSVIEDVSWRLRHAAGNFYINDKPTGAVVGQQPFGGARGSGTNDKSGSLLNLTRWVSMRSIKETFNPPTDYRYPFMSEE